MPPVPVMALPLQFGLFTNISQVATLGEAPAFVSTVSIGLLWSSDAPGGAGSADALPEAWERTVGALSARS